MMSDGRDEWAGRLITRLELERWAAADDGAGGFDGGWSAAGGLWAEMRPAGQARASAGETGGLHGRMRVRLNAAEVDETCRLRLGARAFTVLSVTRDPAAPGRMELLVEERAA